MIANVHTSMFSHDAWTPPMICLVLAEQLVNCSRRSARWRQSSAGLLSSELLEPSGLQQSPTVDAVDLTPWPQNTEVRQIHRSCTELSFPHQYRRLEGDLLTCD